MAKLLKVAAGSTQPSPKLARRIFRSIRMLESGRWTEQEMAVVGPELAAELASSSNGDEAATSTESTAVPAAMPAAGASTAGDQAAAAAPSRSLASPP
jgi:predicted lipid-binding transport protein (Tim44 family)